MIDPVELVTLPEALRLVVAAIADIDLARGRQSLRDKYEAMGFFLPEPSENSRDPFAKSNKQGSASWSQRELAVFGFQSAIVKGDVETYAQDPASGALFRLDSGDWRGAAFREETIRGGIIRASACESIEKHRGRIPLARTDSIRRWLAAEKSRRPAADEAKCRAWLLEAMLANPTRRIKAKLEWQKEAKQLFGVTVRPFNRAWRSAIEESGSTWGRAGAPRKPLQ
jgi:hypothetical protein